MGRFDRAVSATVRHVKEEQFKQHRALRHQRCSNEYSISDSGSDVLLAVFECRWMTPVAARVPLTVEDENGHSHDGDQLNYGHWFREAFGHEDQSVVAKPKLVFRRL